MKVSDPFYNEFDNFVTCNSCGATVPKQEAHVKKWFEMDLVQCEDCYDGDDE